MAKSAHHNSPDGKPYAGTGRTGAFSTTHWSVVLTAGSGDPAHSAAALEKLCRQYWHPIYAFVRRRGADRHEAEDLTQSFFAHLLDKESLKKVDRQKGKFRTFLLASLTNFLANEWDKRRTLKRGGEYQIMPLHEVAEEMYKCEPTGSATPEKLFDRRWALLLVEAVRTRLKAEYLAQKKVELFAKLESGLTGELSAGWYGNVAVELGMSEGATRVALHRLRRRFGDLLREEVAQTVGSNAEVDEEIRHLFAVMTR
jgi:RNA polymerase sigma-70 factor (ECF subfamily)